MRLKQISVLVKEPLPDSECIASRAMKRLRTTASCAKSEYMDTRYLVLTSNVCERMFSIANHTLTNQRRGILLVNFECQIFLYMNLKFMGIDDIKSIVYGNAVDTMHDKENT